MVNKINSYRQGIKHRRMIQDLSSQATGAMLQGSGKLPEACILAGKHALRTRKSSLSATTGLIS
jgi:hypothetical protein